MVDSLLEIITERGNQMFYNSIEVHYVKVSSQQLRGTLTRAFWKVPYSWRFYKHGSRYMPILSSRL